MAVGFGVAVAAGAEVSDCTGVSVEAVASGAMVGGTAVGVGSLAHAREATASDRAKIARTKRVELMRLDNCDTGEPPCGQESRLLTTVASIPMQTKQGGADEPRSGYGLHCDLMAQVPKGMTGVNSRSDCGKP